MLTTGNEIDFKFIAKSTSANITIFENGEFAILGRLFAYVRLKVFFSASQMVFKSSNRFFGRTPNNGPIGLTCSMLTELLTLSP